MRVFCVYNKMPSTLAFIYIIETINLISLGKINHKLGALVILLSKCRSFTCIHAPMVRHAIAQKITIRPL